MAATPGGLPAICASVSRTCVKSMPPSDSLPAREWKPKCNISDAPWVERAIRSRVHVLHQFCPLCLPEVVFARLVCPLAALALERPRHNWRRRAQETVRHARNVDIGVKTQWLRGGELGCRREGEGLEMHGEGVSDVMHWGW